MGDIAIGKTFTGGAEIAPVTTASIGQLISDLQEQLTFQESLPEGGPVVLDGSLVQQLQAFIPQDVDGDLLIHLKQYCDQGLKLFINDTTYLIHDGATILAQDGMPPAEGAAFIIGESFGPDVEEPEYLFMDAAGYLYTIGDGGSLNPLLTLGAALGMFQMHVIRKEIEWCDEWMSLK